MQLETHICETMFPAPCGWGNGYVGVPEGHPAYGKHYDEMYDKIDVHGGLTFSEHYDDVKDFPKSMRGMWIFGFDTCHYGDTPQKWTIEAVQAETERLRDQLENMM